MPKIFAYWILSYNKTKEHESVLCVQRIERMNMIDGERCVSVCEIWPKTYIKYTVRGDGGGGADAGAGGDSIKNRFILSKTFGFVSWAITDVSCAHIANNIVINVGRT